MKQKITNTVFIISSIFIVLAIGTILKGDIENTKEALIMAGFLSFFFLVILFTKWAAVSKLLSR